MKISISLELASGKFDTDTARSAKQFEKRMKDFEKSATKAFKVVSTALVASGGALAVFVTKQAEAIGKFKDLSEIMGDTAENIASIKGAADTTSTSFDTIASASIKLTKGLAGVDDETKGAGAAIAALGLNFEDFKKLAPVDQLEQVAKAMNRFGEGAGRTNVALALFGKSGAELLPFLNELATTSQRQITLTQAEIQAADDYADATAKLKGEIGTLSSVIAVQLIQVMNDALKVVKDVTLGTDGLNDSMAKIRTDGQVKAFAEDFAVGAATVAESVYFLLKVLRTLGGSFESVFADMAFGVEQIKAIQNPARLLLEENRKALLDALEKRNKTAKEANERYIDLWEYNATALSDALKKNFAAAKGLQDFNPLAGIQAGLDKSPLIFRSGMEPVEQQIPFRQGFSASDKPTLNFDPTPALARTAKAAKEAKAAIYEMEQSVKDAMRAEEDFRAEADRLTESLRKPEEIYKAQIQSIDTLYNGLYIDAETRTRALGKASEDLIASLEDVVPVVEETATAMSTAWDEATRSMQNSLSDFLFDPFQDGLKGMLKSFGETLRRMAADAAAAQIMDAVLGKQGTSGSRSGGYLDAAIKWAGEAWAAYSASGGGKAMGGPVMAGTSYLVGERGPEMFVPKTAGDIVPNHKMGGMTNNFYTTVMAPESRITKESDMQLKRRLGSTVAEAMRRNG